MALKQISEIYEAEPEKFISYANRVQEGINTLNIVESKSDSFENIDLEKYSELLLKNIDDEFGGFKGAPKFMMPNNLQYLLRYSFQESNENSKNKISNEEVAELTLECLKNNVPSSVPGIAFLSGGQTEIEATANLNQINIKNNTDFNEITNHFVYTGLCKKC